MTASWQQLIIQTTATYVDDICECLQMLGVIAVTLQDAGDEPLFEPAPGTTPCWTQTQIIALFAPDVDLNYIIATVKDQFEITELNFQCKTLVEQNWQQQLQQEFTPMCFGKRLWIYPSWHTPPNPNTCNVMLDPGLAFGTGTHPTTALCLAWLDRHLQANNTVIDYGCGSGVLAIAAAKLGAKHVWATDNDTQALQATQDNATRNHIDPSQFTIVEPTKFPPVTCDVLLANILANPLIELATMLVKLVKKNGIIILSGMLKHQRDEVIRAYQPWCKLIAEDDKAQWICLNLIKLS